MLIFTDNYPLSNITTLGIGGMAKKFVEVKEQKELLEAITFAKQNALDYLLIGGGSNLLISDSGVNKLIIKNNLTGITTLGSHLESVRLNVKSGTTLQDLVDFAIENNLGGLQKLSGIPGTVGGAVFGSAGAYGQSISDNLIEVKAFDGNKIVDLTKQECEFNYRDSVFKRNHFVILAVKFSLSKGDQQTLEKEAKDIIIQRSKKYPPGIKCPGSFFKNIIANTLPREILEKIPQEKIIFGKLPAGFLLEEVGALGASLGNIEIAPYHANLFINKGGGNAKDFYDLAKEMSEKVKERFGIKLGPEVQLINLPPL